MSKPKLMHKCDGVLKNGEKCKSQNCYHHFEHEYKIVIQVFVKVAN